jgi:asparagine synthase (glutamine-hydrolysing)
VITEEQVCLMFRYIALSWDTANLLDSQAAKQLAMKLHMPGSGWQPVLSRPGLSVFTADTQPGVNKAYLLPPDRGVVLGKLFRRSELDHPAAPDVALTANDVSRILHNSGRALVDDYWGRYIALLYDASGGVRILRDPSGALPCYLVHHRGVSLIFSWLDDVLTLVPGLPAPTVNWDYLAVHIPSHVLECRETAIDGVTQILAGEAVLARKDTTTCEVYWSPIEIARTKTDENQANAAAALRRTVRSCVQSWARCYGDLMLRFSGGLDSSIVLSCLAAGSTSARVTCITHYSAGSDSDERVYARLAATRAQRELIEVERDPGLRLERILDVARTPNPSYYFQRLDMEHLEAGPTAACGASAVFSGGGGDQLFYEIPTFWPAADYLRQHGLGAGFFAAAIDAARLGRVSVWKALGFAFLDRLRLLPVDPRADIVAEDIVLIKPGVVAAARRDRRFMHPALQSIADVPPGKLVQGRALLYPDEYYDQLRTLSAPESLSPLMSQPVVELCLRLPTYLLTRGGRGRALARQAFAADLPAEIARRRSKGGMEEHVKAVLLRNLDFVRGMLLEGMLVRRGIVDRARLEEVLSGRPTAIASPLMEIYLCLGIEGWLNRWPATQQAAAAA